MKACSTCGSASDNTFTMTATAKPRPLTVSNAPYTAHPIHHATGGNHEGIDLAGKTQD